MNKFKLILASLTAILPLWSIAQQPVTTKLTEINIHNVETIEKRVFLLHSIQENEFFNYRLSDEEGKIDIFVTDDYTCQESNANADFDAFIEQFETEWMAYSNLDKNERGQLFVDWRYQLEDPVFLMINEDFHRQLRNRDNSTCDGADPFCTDNGLYQFPAGVNAGNLGSSTPPYYCSGFVRPNGAGTSNCLSTTPNPAFYYMQIDQPGNLNIYMYSTPSHDIDFDCWGPFSDINTACSQLSCSNMVDCSYSINSTENCHINNAQTGQYYILLITNYSNQSCNISFSNIGTGTTNCGILPPLVSGGGPYCVGETIYLTAQGQSGASYSWTGPAGFNSNQQNPTRPNCTLNMAGTYTCTITVGSQTNSATTEAVVIYPDPTSNFTFTSVCKGTPTQFTSTATTNPSGQTIQSYQWNFGDGQTGSGQSVTHTYAQAGNYQVTHTVSTGNGHCTDQKTQTVPVYAAPVASATAQPSTVIYGGTATLTASAGTTGSFNFHWEPANMVVNPDAQTTQTVPLQATQTFTVTVTNPQGGCSSTAQVTVSMEGSNMTAMASADQYELCEGESTTLHAQPSGGTGNYTFSWTPANTLNNANIQNPVATPPVGETTYTCAVSDGITTQNVSVTIMVHPNEVEDVDHTICENDVYNFYGEDIQTPGVYEHHTQTEFGCDKLIRLHLYNWDTYETPITDHFCQGEHYQFFDQSLSTSGIYYHTLESVHGCDSVIRLNLIQDPSYEVELWESTCEGGPGYYYNGDYLQPSAYPYVYNFESVLGCDSVVSLHIEEAEYNSKTYSVSLCATEYTWASNGVTYYETGTYYDTLSFPNSCDSTLVLNLELRPSYDIEVHVTSCDSYHWKNDAYNVDMTFNQSTVYTHPYVNSYGCDSEATLYLTINDHDDIEFTVSDEENCDEYFWDPQGHEIVYTDHNELTYNMTGTYHRTYKNIYDCDSLVTMYVQFEYTPHPTEIYPMDATNTAPHWVVTATEFQINAYDFNLWDTNPNCHWDSVTWNFAQPVNWILEPFGEKNQCCKVYVLSRVEDTVWLEAHAYNRCAPQDGITQRYWLISSFIGIDEDELSTGSAAFDVIPNPNNGQMQLNLERLTGKIDIKVYDMKGTLIDQFEAHNSGSGTYDYNMKGKADGIYFFVATSKEGTVARKVVVQK
jgi:PKD repeat protein